MFPIKFSLMAKKSDYQDIIKKYDDDQVVADIDYGSFSTLNEFNLEFISFNKKSREIKNRSYVANKKSFVIRNKFTASDIISNTDSLQSIQQYFRYGIIPVSYYSLPTIVEYVKPFSDPHISQITGVALPG